MYNTYRHSAITFEARSDFILLRSPAANLMFFRYLFDQDNLELIPYCSYQFREP